MLSRVRIQNLGIAGKVYLWGVLILLFAFLVGAVLSWFIAGDQARARIENEIYSALNAFKADFDYENGQVRTAGDWLAKEPAFVAAVQAHDTPGLAAYLKPWMDAGVVDVFWVCDPNGIVLAQMSTDRTSGPGDLCSTSPGAATALKGERTSGLELNPNGRLEGRYQVPIYATSSPSPIGVLGLGFFLDGSSLQRVLHPGASQVAIVYQDRIRVTTLVDQAGNSLVGLSTPPEVLTAQKDNRSSGPVTLDTVQGQYLFIFRPLESQPNRVVGMYGMGVSLASLLDERTALFRGFGIALAMATLVVLAVGFILARVFVAPIRALDSAAQNMARGDLSASIAIPSQDEVGGLARQLDHMRQQLRQALHTSNLEKNRYEAIIRCMGVAAVITDPDNRIVSVNPHAELLLGQSQAELVKLTWQDIFTAVKRPESGSPSFWELGQPSVDDKSPVIRGRFRLRAQPQVLLGVISSPVEVGSEATGYVHIIQDISAQEKLLQSEDEFMLVVAHEVRGPLASLRSFIELLYEDYATMSKHDVKLLLQAQQRAATKFQELVETLLDIGTVQAGQFRVHPMAIGLATLVQDAVSQVEPLIKANEQTLEVQIEDSACMVVADGPRIVQVIINLLSNASKYSPENQPIVLSVARSGNFQKIQVCDRGPGISPEDQVHLFERFYRVKHSAPGATGLGLGLALAKAIVDAHGGQIGLNSQPGAGSTFWFTLPEVK